MGIKIESPVFALSKKIKTRSAIIGVVGLGYVGLPLALEIVNKGFEVIGFDKDDGKISKLKSGDSYIADMSNAIIKKAVNEEKFEPTSDFSKLVHADIIIIVYRRLRLQMEHLISRILLMQLMQSNRTCPRIL